MTAYIALLRGINIGGRNLLAMADLRAMLVELGFAEPRTLLQSGNAVFRAGGRATGGTALETRLEEAAAARFGRPIHFMVRAAAEWAEVIARNPFPEAAARDPSHYVTVFLKHAPPPAAAEALRAAIRGPELVHVEGRCAYIVYGDAMRDSKLTPAVIDAKLGTRGTGRNWNTVLKLSALAAPAAS